MFTHLTLFCESLILKVKGPANIVGWVYKGGKLENSYCLYDRNYLLLARASDASYNQNPIFNIFKEHEDKIISSNFSISNTRFVSLDVNNTIVEHSFTDESYSKKRLAHEKLKALSIAISPDDGMEIIGFENGFIGIHSLLKKSKKGFDLYFKAHKGAVHSIKFNSLGNYFISSGQDDCVKIWDSKDLKMIAQFSAFTKNGFSSFFSPLKDDFVYLSDEKMLVVSNIAGDSLRTIFVNEGIKMASFTEGEEKIAILTLDGHLLFYSISTGKMLGELNCSSSSSINSFSVNIILGDIVLGTEEGEVYLYNKEDIVSGNLAKKNKKEVVKKGKTKEKTDTSYSTKKTDSNKEENSNKEISDDEFLDNKIEYWGLEDAPALIDFTISKPSFSIKDETPLEEPMEVRRKEEAKVNEKKEKARSTKELNATVFDDDFKFPENDSNKKERNKATNIDALPLKEEDKYKDTDSEDDESQKDDESPKDDEGLKDDESAKDEMSKEEEE